MMVYTYWLYRLADHSAGMLHEDCSLRFSWSAQERTAKATTNKPGFCHEKGYMMETAQQIVTQAAQCDFAAVEQRLALNSRYFGADRHIRRGGRGEEWSGDACVAHDGQVRSGGGTGRRATQGSPPFFPARYTKYLPLRGNAWRVSSNLCSLLEHSRPPGKGLNSRWERFRNREKRLPCRRNRVWCRLSPASLSGQASM